MVEMGARRREGRFARAHAANDLPRDIHDRNTEHEERERNARRANDREHAEGKAEHERARGAHKNLAG